MAQNKRPTGRPGRYAKFERFEASLPEVMAKRPAYCDGIGIFRGTTSSSVWVKIRFPRGAMYRGRSIQPGGSVEHKLGKRSSWEWKELISERDRLQRLADRGEPLESAEVPIFGIYASEWLERKESTLRSFGVTRGNVERSLKPAFGRKALNDITANDVNRWIGKQRKNLKPASVQRELNTLKAILNDAVRGGLIERNPAATADQIKGIEPRLRFITDREWEQLLSTAEAIEADQNGNRDKTPHQIRGWLHNFIVWALNSGMRRSEILGLTWGHVRRLDSGTTVIHVENTKTGKPRTVTCTTEMDEVLEALGRLDRRPEDDRLFPLSMSTLKRSLTRLWKASGLRDVRLHDLRRTHATILIQQNVDPRTVAGRLGHTGTSMLARHYAVDRGDIEAARAFSDRPTRDKAAAKVVPDRELSEG